MEYQIVTNFNVVHNVNVISRGC